MVTYHPGVDDDSIFRALADPTRRHLLDRLFERDGRTLTELESELENGDRPDREKRAGERVIVLRQALLHRVAEHDQQDQVERLERRQLSPADHPHQHVEKDEDEDAAENDVHG